MEVVLDTEGKSLYKYGFDICRNEVVKEWLHKDNKLVFEREQQGFKKHAAKYKSVERMTRKDALFLSVAAQFNNTEYIHIQDVISRRIRVVDCESDMHKLSAYRDEAIKLFATSEEFQEFVKKQIAIIDLFIQDIKLVAISEKRKFFSLDYGGVEIFEDEISSGTRNFIYFLALIFNVIKKEQILVFDDIDNYFDETAISRVISLFAEQKDDSKASFVFTTKRKIENTNLMTIFVQKNSESSYIE